MLHPHTELRFINHKIGYGVVATQLIPRGAITWARDDLDQVFPAAQVTDMTPLYRDLLAKYAFVDAKGDFVLCWDLARYMNHSCDPSCMGTGYDFELAVRDIQPGEELTADYGSLNLEYDFTCLCGSAKCRKVLRRGDFLKYADGWDHLIAGSFRLISTVPQPLWPFVKDKDAVQAALVGRTPIASCRENHFGVSVLTELPSTSASS
jgi:hypothetical protein